MVEITSHTSKTRRSEQTRKQESTIFFGLWRCDPTRVMASSLLRFLDHTQRRNTVGRTPLDEWSARSRDLNLTTHNTHNRQTSMPPVGFEPTISSGERPQTYALDRAATGTSNKKVLSDLFQRTLCIETRLPSPNTGIYSSQWLGRKPLVTSRSVTVKRHKICIKQSGRQNNVSS